MLAAAQRLRRREDFAATIRNGRRAGRGAVVVHLLNPGSLRPGVSGVPDPSDLSASGRPASPTSGLPTMPPSDLPASPDSGAGSARAGFVVSKAVGNAVVRNAVKRRLRHLVRPLLADLPAGSVLVVRALPEAAARPYAILQQDLDAALDAVRRPKNRGVRR
ncbi:ribonuclease P protein component [Dactylosporangium sp. McL0621]|uniref:ribonuclease P protein component n=1 Tax=Dactylosporangium sp. McL0621 TaxID=3415678 RepID=UPI003CE6E01D